MKPTSLVVSVGLVAAAAGQASAGGLTLPGAGAVSTSRAGASLAAADDGEALVINPAGLAKAHEGIEITVSAAIISYAMKFTRSGTYDAITDSGAMAEDHAYEGQKYPTITNAPKPPLGLGSYQPVPVVAITSDLGGAIKGLRAAIGLYAPNAYPFRDMTHVGGHSFQFNQNFDQPPPPTRYDIMNQEAAILVPSIAAGYRITDKLDVGARFGMAFATLKSTVAVWGLPFNYQEWVKEDGQVKIDAKDSWIPTWSLGATFRPAPAIELAANYTSSIDVNAKGTATAETGPNVTIGGQPSGIFPVTGANAKCADGGTMTAFKACASLAIPQNAQIGARYKFLDRAGTFRGDVELDLDWENWGKNENNDNVVIDAQASTLQSPDTGLQLKPSVIYHGFRDTYAARLGGSYIVPAGGADLTLRGGIGYDTAAAKDGWERVDVDGAARTTIAVGAGYKMRRVEINAGFGVILEGSRTNARTCNPTISAQGCAGTNTDQPQADRTGPDPTTPLSSPFQQTESPVNQGTMVSHYVMFMLGVKTWF